MHGGLTACGALRGLRQVPAMRGTDDANYALHAHLHRTPLMKEVTTRLAAVAFTIVATLLISVLAVGEMAIFRRSKSERTQ